MRIIPRPHLVRVGLRKHAHKVDPQPMTPTRLRVIVCVAVFVGGVAAAGMVGGFVGLGALFILAHLVKHKGVAIGR